jgi:hypothetical protein
MGCPYLGGGGKCVTECDGRGRRGSKKSGKVRTTFMDSPLYAAQKKIGTIVIIN